MPFRFPAITMLDLEGCTTLVDNILDAMTTVRSQLEVILLKGTKISETSEIVLKLSLNDDASLISRAPAVGVVVTNQYFVERFTLLASSQADLLVRKCAFKTSDYKLLP
jgi:hypothetical protein